MVIFPLGMIVIEYGWIAVTIIFIIALAVVIVVWREEGSVVFSSFSRS